MAALVCLEDVSAQLSVSERCTGLPLGSQAVRMIDRKSYSPVTVRKEVAKGV